MFEVVANLIERDWRLVALACTLCFFTSVVAVNLFHRAQAATGRRLRVVWLSLDAAALGFGVWATHLIAILAHDPGIAASYNLGLTLLSLLIGALIAGVGLMVALLDFGRWTPALGGAIVGCGAAATHYTGMLALQLPGRLTWLPELALASLLLGMVLAALALVVAATRNDWASAPLAAGLLTLAIVTTVFTGITAVSFVRDPGTAALSSDLSLARHHRCGDSHTRYVSRRGLEHPPFASGAAVPEISARYGTQEHVARTVHVRI